MFASTARAVAPKAYVTVVATWNNTFVSVSRMNGDVVVKASGGSAGFKVCNAPCCGGASARLTPVARGVVVPSQGAKKSSTAAAQAAAALAGQKAVEKVCITTACVSLVPRGGGVLVGCRWC